MRTLRTAVAAGLLMLGLAVAPGASSATADTPPVAYDDLVTVASGASVDINVVANDTDADGDAVRLGWISVPDHGAISVNADGSIHYTAKSSYAGTDFFLYASTDGTENSGAGGVTITVIDRTAPVLSLPSPAPVEATSPAGTPVAYAASATDNVDGAVAATCTPGSASVLPLGVTTVRCSAKDAAGNIATGSFDVTVLDRTAPVLTVPAGPVAAVQGLPVTYAATATDNADTSPRVQCSTPSGSTFPSGTTHVTCTATDASGNTASTSFDVVAPANSSPVCARIALTASVLSASGGGLRTVTLSGATDADGDRLTYRVDAVAQDELVSAGTHDAFLLGGASLLLRAERAGGGDGRVYTIAYTVSDGRGGTCGGTALVAVPHDAAHAAVKSRAAYDSLG
jgi:hypothetical protein